MKKWLKTTLILISFSLLLIALFNFIMDPLWTFEHSHEYNQYQRAAKERQQKSHSIYFRSNKYNTLLIGSSRTALMNQNLWVNKGDVFNYAFSDVTPDEYIPYIDFAIKNSQQPITHIILALDFFGALDYHPFIATQANSILSSITEDFYRWKLLFSFSALNYSLKNTQYYFSKRLNTYTRDNIKRCPTNATQNIQNFRQQITPGLLAYKNGRFSKSYNENYKKTLLTLKQKYPNVQFTVYTTPVTLEHLNTLIETGHYPDYERWLKEVVSVFGSVHHFMYKNEFSIQGNKYFSDSHHPLARTTECVAKEVQGLSSLCIKNSIQLNKDSIQSQLKELRIKNEINNSN